MQACEINLTKGHAVTQEPTTYLREERAPAVPDQASGSRSTDLRLMHPRMLRRYGNEAQHLCTAACTRTTSRAAGARYCLCFALTDPVVGGLTLQQTSPGWRTRRWSSSLKGTIERAQSWNSRRREFLVATKRTQQSRPLSHLQSPLRDFWSHEGSLLATDANCFERW